MSSPRTFRVLMADDDPSVIATLTSVLSQDGYELCAVGDGQAALDRIPEFAPDLVLLDYQMPLLEGVDVCRALRANPATRLLPVVFITGLDDRATKLECIAAGCNDFLNKPFDALELLTRTRSLLQTKSLIDQLASTESVMITLARLLEARDPYTHGHSERVADYTVALAQWLDLSAEDQQRLRQAGWLHDLGKVAVRTEVLHKPGPLTEEEFAHIQIHPVVGVHVLAELRFAQLYLPSVRHHHERFDGKGYPDRLAGDAIPLDARMMAIADAFDAMTSNRPYRAGMSREQALAIMAENRGPQWDPRLVRGFLAIMREP